jgi:hypothetical protein
MTATTIRLDIKLILLEIFIPFMKKFDNYYRYLINGQQLSQPLPNYIIKIFISKRQEVLSTKASIIGVLGSQKRMNKDLILI